MKNLLLFKIFICLMSFQSLGLNDSLDQQKNNKNYFITDSAMKSCNDFFQKKKALTGDEANKYKNFFMCKFSKKRNRLYVYMLSENRIQDVSIKESCKKILRTWPDVLDHMNSKLQYQVKKHLAGFFSPHKENHSFIKSNLDKLIRYKVFINDIKKFKSYSCNWKPGKGLNPYIKIEKFKEFDNI